ncbi:hypothetical protein [Microbacterium sp. 22242]|uniref:hypothetical protein n=1 Tax=Microbacterium sp. 22242 TaxID=3453896 RepID=UPI003F878A5F
MGEDGWIAGEPVLARRPLRLGAAWSLEVIRDVVERELELEPEALRDPRRWDAMMDPPARSSSEDSRSGG